MESLAIRRQDDGRPLAIWTPSGEASDLEQSQKFGFKVASFQSAAFTRNAGGLPAALPTAGDAVSLPANQYGVVVVQPESGGAQCIVDTTFVGCETDGTDGNPTPTAAARTTVFGSTPTARAPGSTAISVPPRRRR